MSGLRVGTRVTAAYGKVVAGVFVPDVRCERGIVVRVRERCFFVKFVDQRGEIRLYRGEDDEGTWWARGWSTNAVKALRASVAL